MQNKLLYILLTLIAFVVALFQRQRIKDLKRDNELYEIQLYNIGQINKLNLLDLEKRNAELKIKNEELNAFYNDSELISRIENEKYNKKEIFLQDCITQPINDNIIKLLQKAGI